jgi:hypothetical protein
MHKRHISKTAIAAAFATIAAARAVHAGVAPVGSPIQVQSPTTDYIYSHSVARNPSGSFIAAWATQDNSTFAHNLNLQVFDSQGAPTIQEISLATQLQDVAPTVAINDSGDFVTAWTDIDQQPAATRHLHVYAQKFSSSGSPVGNLIDVADFGLDSLALPSKPSVAMDPAGDFVVAWNGDADTIGSGGPCYLYPLCRVKDTFQYTTYARVFGTDAAPRTGTLTAYQSAVQTVYYTTAFTPIKAYHSRSKPGVAMDAAGNVVLAFDVPDSTNEDIYTTRFSADGTGQQQTLVKSFAYRLATTGTSVAMNDADNFVVLWGQKNALQKSTTLYAQRYAAGGSAQGSAISIAADKLAGATTEPVVDQAVAMTAQGDFCVTWGIDSSASLPFILTGYAQCYHADGSANGSLAQLFSGSAGGIETAMDGSGSLVALYDNTTCNCLDGRYVRAQLFSAP